MDQPSHSIDIVVNMNMDKLLYNIIIYTLIMFGVLFVMREYISIYYKIKEIIRLRREIKRNGTNS